MTYNNAEKQQKNQVDIKAENITVLTVQYIFSQRENAESIRFSAQGQSMAGLWDQQQLMDCEDA